MKRILLLVIFCLVLSCVFCKKKSTDTDTVEDIIKVEVTVKENGIAVENIFVIIDSKVQESVKGTVDDVDVVSYETSQNDQITTNSSGIASFTYRNKSLPDRGGIVIEKVTIKRLSTVLSEDTQERFIKKGETLKLSYDI